MIHPLLEPWSLSQPLPPTTITPTSLPATPGDIPLDKSDGLMSNTPTDETLQSEEISSTTHLTLDDTLPKAEPADEQRRREGSVRDESVRLRQLGYDTVLGRPFDVWSSAAIGFCYLGFMSEWYINTALYLYKSQLVFIVGYPPLVALHYALIGPFAELASAYPVAGAMATWSWQAARAGVRFERQWAWLVGGFVLALHLAKIIAATYLASMAAVSLFVTLGGSGEFDPVTGVPTDYQEWWDLVFYLAIILLAAVIALTGLVRRSCFWVTAGVFNLCVILGGLVLLAVAIPKVAKVRGPQPLAFPKPQPGRNSALYIFAALPSGVAPIDGPAHMSEETKNPSRAVPRAMFASWMIHSTLIYVFTILYGFSISFSAFKSQPPSPTFPIAYALGMGPRMVSVLLVFMILSHLTSIVAAMMVTSRFIFALARDRAIPLAGILVKTTKHKEPRAAMIAVLTVMVLSTFGVMIPSALWLELVTAVSYWFINVGYLIPLLLYIVSKLDLRESVTAEFVLRGWGKVLAGVASAWLIAGAIIGCLPPTEWTTISSDGDRPGVSSFPIAFGGMLVIMASTWLFYGRRHYIGPIRAITKWSAGVEIDPQAALAQRNQALNQHIKGMIGQKQSSLRRAVDKGNPSPLQFPMADMTGRGDCQAGSMPLDLGSPGHRERGVGGSRQNIGGATELHSAPALLESKLFPLDTGRASAIDSRLFTDFGDAAAISHAQIESQLLPEESHVRTYHAESPDRASTWPASASGDNAQRIKFVT